MALNRDSVPANRKWRVEDIFENQDAWETAFRKVSDALAENGFEQFKGRLSDPETLLACMTRVNEIMLDMSRLDVYAFMRGDEDTRKSEFVALKSRMSQLEMQLSGQIAFITPELTSLSVETLEALAADPRLSDFDYSIRSVIKEKPHVLSPETEQILSQASKVFGAPQQVFGMLNNADFPFPTIKVDGKPVKLTHGTYGMLLQSPDRKVRKAAFQAYYNEYIKLIHTITAAYVGNVDKDVFLARARNYNSCLEKAMAGEDVDVKVYKNLLRSVNKALPLLHRYFRDKKKILGYKSMHMYDIYTPLVENAEIKVDYEEAFKIVKEGLSPLGERYQALLQEAHDNGWIDVEETEGKRSGAYSVSVFGIPHPYVLLNYQQTTSSVFTLAHELGHAMHSYHSERNQPQEKADYKIFVAEVASTVNEVLLVRYLLRTTTDVKLKKYLLSYYMDTLKGTLFRQTQFAEFEFIAHDMAEKGQPLTCDALNEVYYTLNKKYYGRSVVSDPEIAYEWARIPHFYRGFYVYKYATGIISAVSIAHRIETEGAPAVEDYFRFLSSGGSDSPVELLKLAGVDLTKMDAFNAAMDSFREALTEFEAL